MYRALPASRQVAQRGRVIAQRSTRRFASSTAEPPPPPKKRSFVRRLVLYSSGLTIFFYAVSPVVAFNNERYHAFFSESVPLGTAILEFVEDEGYDRNLRSPVLASAIISIKNGTDSVVRSVSGLLGSPSESQNSDKPKEGIREKVAAAKATTLEKIAASKEKAKNAKERVVEVADTMKTKVEKTASTAKDLATGAVSSVQKSSESAASETKKTAIKYSEGVEELVQLAEAALAGKPIERLPEATTTPSQPAAAPSDFSPKSTDTLELTASDVVAAVKEATDSKVYTELPVGFEPPPGYSKPKPAKLPEPSRSGSKESSKPAPLPKVAPSVAEISKSEPVISHLASTIDALAAYLAETPSASTNAVSVLENAEKDLKELASRIERVREEEHDKLDMAMDEQARAYALKLLETELAARDKLDEQELEFRQFLDQERQEAMQMYREKLAKELETQSEIINERLKQEVIAQGIEMQRRWIREIKVRVEQERGGRLSKLSELAAELKRLERITLDNAAYLDENLRIHSLWVALRALSSASVESPTRRPFRDELRILRHVANAREDELVSTVLDTLEKSDAPDVGVEPLADLTTWLTTSVAPQVARVALVPEQNAGVLSHLASYLLSTFTFKRQGLVEGDDVMSVLARAEHYMNEKDLDSASRELNQLKGTAKVLMSDWLAAARRRLEVLQALEVVQSQATLASLLVV